MEKPLLTLSILVFCHICFHNAYIPVKDKDIIVDLQNQLRRNENASNMNKLEWNDALSEMAESWVDQCIYGHGGLEDPNGVYSAVGQNLYVSNSAAINYTDVVHDWYKEKVNYAFDTQVCKKICGHYLQLVWADTLLVGCAYKDCSPIKGLNWARGFVLVCNYAAAGNYPDMDPYIKGKPCSNCDSCEKGLCVGVTYY